VSLTGADVLPATADGPLGPPARVRVRRWARVAALVVGVLGLALLIGAISASGPRGYLDPGSAGPEGGRALRVLLEQQGIQVTVVRDAAAASADAAHGLTLFVPDVSDLGDRDLSLVWSDSADLVATDPDDRAVPHMIPGMQLGHSVTEQVREPACGLRAATLAGTALTGGSGLQGQPASGTVEACYAARGEGTVVRQTLPDGRTVTVVGSGTAFTNGAIGADGNAALALNLLGGHSVLIWYAPAPGSPPADGASDFTDLLPPWVGIVIAQLVVVVLVAALWRGRRLGPVVVEPLPVDVRAAETTEGRARLYRRRGARGRAAEHLRAASRSRMMSPLGLPPGSSREAVVAQVAARSGWAQGDVANLLYGAAPHDDAGLVGLASALDSLERQVRRP
jgi:hypothetical protein